MSRRTALLAVGLLVACSTKTLKGEASDPHGPTSRDLARALIAAPPGRWEEAAAPVLSAGRPMAPVLIEALQEDSSGAGVQIAIACLGALGGTDARDFLIRCRDRSPRIAAEAMLALGQLGTPADESVLQCLRDVAGRPGASPLQRSAAAASLLDLGQDAEALPLLAAILRAGTPAGRAESERLGLPDKARWAHERHIAIESIRRRTGGEDYGLDPDLAWPDLDAAVTRMTDALLPADGNEER